ncbi:MAG TPA: hypothetical protein VF857_11255, partial [Spirochaetota bacterium]
MKKILASVIMMGFAIAAIAEEKPEDPIKLTPSITGNFYSTGYKTVTKDENGSYTASRLRPQLAISKGSLEAVLKLEVDATWGSKSGATKSSENVGLGADETNVEVANAYFKNTFDALPSVSAIAGIAAYDYPLVW